MAEPWPESLPPEDVCNRLAIRHQVYEWRDSEGTETFWWDITLAILARDGGEIILTQTAEPEQLEGVKRNNEWAAAAVARAGPRVHGIAAPIIKDGAIIYILIDGTHRAVRSLETGEPFAVDLLTDAAAMACQIPKSRTLWTVKRPVIDSIIGKKTP